MSDIDTLHCAATLLMLRLQSGSRAEVFWDDRFWQVTIDSVHGNGFWFTYIGSDDEFGFVEFKDFLLKWRFDAQAKLGVKKMRLMRSDY